MQAGKIRALPRFDSDFCSAYLACVTSLYLVPSRMKAATFRHWTRITQGSNPAQLTAMMSHGICRTSLECNFIRFYMRKDITAPVLPNWEFPQDIQLTTLVLYLDRMK